jgi:outer membrane receptor for ferrienterochelin and colicins
LKWKTGEQGYWQSDNGYAYYHRLTKTYRTDLSTAQKTDAARSPSDSAVEIFNDITSRTTYSNAWKMIHYTAGYDANMEFASDAAEIKDGNKYEGDYALFLSADATLLQHLMLQPALRYDYNTLYNAPLSPSLSLLYKPMEQLQLRASYSKGFRAPTLKELYLNFHDVNHNIDGNPDLKAEYSHHVQASAIYSLFDKPQKTGALTLTGFYDDVHNQISLFQNDSVSQHYIYENIGHSRIFVTQLKSNFTFAQLTFSAGGSYTKSFETLSQQNNQPPQLTPSFHYVEANATAHYTLPKLKTGFSVFYKYTGPQPMLGNITGGAIYGAEVKEFHTIDVSADKAFLKNSILLTVGVHNLANNAVLSLAAGSNIPNPSSNPHGDANSLNVSTGRSFFVSMRVQLEQ